MVLRLWSGAMDPRDNLPPFLLKMDGLMSIKHDSGRELSKVVGLKTHPARRIVHGESLLVLKMSELLFLPFVQVGQYCGQGGGGVRTFPSTA